MFKTYCIEIKLIRKFERKRLCVSFILFWLLQDTKLKTQNVTALFSCVHHIFVSDDMGFFVQGRKYFESRWKTHVICRGLPRRFERFLLSISHK